MNNGFFKLKTINILSCYTSNFQNLLANWLTNTIRQPKSSSQTTIFLTNVIFIIYLPL